MTNNIVLMRQKKSSMTTHLNVHNQGSIGRNDTPKSKRHRSRLKIDPNLFHLMRRPIAALDNVGSSRKAQLLGMHGNVSPDIAIVARGSGQFDGGVAGEGEVLEVGGEFEIVADGIDGWGEEDAACCFGGRHGDGDDSTVRCCYCCPSGKMIIAIADVCC